MARQEDYVQDIVRTLNENVKGNSPSPASSDLLKRGAGGLLNEHQKEKFHTIIAKALFVTKRLRPDIGLVVSVLSGRVRMPNKDDWRKMVRLVDYLVGTKELHLRLNLKNGIVTANFEIFSSS